MRRTVPPQATADAFPGGTAHATRAPEAPAAPGVRAVLVRSAKITLLLLGLAVAGITVAAWLGGGERELAVEYDGFD